MTKKGLYIHLPFCKEKCPYCVFSTIESNNHLMISSYIDFIISQINKLNPSDFDTIYLGGGTPNYIDNLNLNKLLSSLDKFSPLEYTIELNPEFITLEQIKLFKQHNINRVSLGIQTFNNIALKSIKRYYDFKMIKKIVNDIKSILTNNISVDIIFNYPYQKIYHLKKDLKKIIKLKISHISIYDLIYEDGSQLNYLIKKKKLVKNDDEISYQGYKYIIKKLTSNKFIHYEISSFAKNNYESIHNKKYWLYQDYQALGLQGASFINNIEYSNANTLNKLYNNEYSFNKLTSKDQMSRYMFMGLRLLCGVDLIDFKARFNHHLEDIFNIKELINNNLVEYNKNFLRLTTKGLFLANQVFEVFI